MDTCFKRTNKTFFPNPPTTFLSCFRGERRKYAKKKVRLNRVSNSQPPGHESDAFTNWPSGRGRFIWERHLISCIDWYFVQLKIKVYVRVFFLSLFALKGLNDQHHNPLTFLNKPYTRLQL